MKKLLPVVLFFAWHATPAQPPIPEWTKVTQIKLLESTRSDVARILIGEDFLSWMAFKRLDGKAQPFRSSGGEAA